jgi:hypothetical protein
MQNLCDTFSFEFVIMLGPSPPRAVNWPQRFPHEIGFLWRFCMGAHGA